MPTVEKLLKLDGFRVIAAKSGRGAQLWSAQFRSARVQDGSRGPRDAR
jgi:hypothetical protein